MPVTRMFASLSVGIFTAVSALHEMEMAGRKLETTVGRNIDGFDDLLADRRSDIEINLRRQLEYQLTAFRETVDEMKPYTPLDKQTTRILAAPRVHEAHPDAVVDVSSSHLVRVTLPEAEIVSVMRAAERELAAGKDVLDDDWFR